MRLQALWGAAACRPASAAAAASAGLPPSPFASGSSLLLRRKAQQRRSGRQLTPGTEARDGKKRRKPQQGGSRDGGGSSSDEVRLWQTSCTCCLLRSKGCQLPLKHPHLHRMMLRRGPVALCWHFTEVLPAGTGWCLVRCRAGADGPQPSAATGGPH